MTTVFDNNIEIFSSRDKIREQIIKYAENELVLENFDWNKSSYLSYLINVLSVLTADTIYYNSSIWKQFFLITADQRESVTNLSAMLGYNVDLATPSTAKVLVTIPLDFMGNTNFTRFYMYGKTDPDKTKSNITHKFYAKEVKFSLLNTLTIEVTKTGTTYTAEIKETFVGGDSLVQSRPYTKLPYEIVTIDDDTKGLRFIATANQVYSLTSGELEFQFPTLKPYEFFTKDIEYDTGQVSDVKIITLNQVLENDIESGTTDLTLEKTKWTSYPSIPLIPETSYGYVMKSISKGVRLFFGNGMYGKQPTNHTSCTISLHLCDGAAGDVIPGSIVESDQISVPVEVDSAAAEAKTVNKKITPTVINPEASYGGKDAPSIDDIRRESIAQVKSNERLVTKDDFDSFSDIATELPISTTTHLLKRSDLKRNEICLFSDMIYNDTVNDESYIVPTRNTRWTVDTTADVNWTIRAGSETTINSKTYVSMFNIEVDQTLLDSKYYYVANNLEVPVTISRAYSSDTKLLPSHCKFYQYEATDPANDKSYFDLFYTKLVNEDLSCIKCNVEIPWSGNVYDLPHSTADSKFYLEFANYIDVQDIPEGAQTYKFTIYDSSVSSDPNTSTVSTAFVEATVKQDLDEFMYSQVRLGTSDSTGSSDIYWVYDVPVILKDYWDKIDQSKFNFYVLSKIVQWDVTKYRMLTDFVNFKFANTTGSASNMLLNPTNRDPVISLNPEDVPTGATNGDRYAVSNDDNPWGRTPGGFIAIASSYTPGGWLFQNLNVNDMFYTIADTVAERSYYVYNGDSIVTPTHELPVVIKAVIWMDSTYSGTDASLVKDVKDTLVNTLYTNFGYNGKLLISELTRIIKSVRGVSNCRVMQPDHDIEYTFNIDDLTEDQLIVYTPELIFFDSSSIDIELRT